MTPGQMVAAVFLLLVLLVFLAGYASGRTRGERDEREEQEARDRDRILTSLQRKAAAQSIVRNLRPDCSGFVRMSFTAPTKLPELDSESSAYLRGFKRQLDPAYCWTEGERARVRAFRERKP